MNVRSFVTTNNNLGSSKHGAGAAAETMITMGQRSSKSMGGGYLRGFGRHGARIAADSALNNARRAMVGEVQ